MPDPMPPIDYMGPQGGMLAMAFAAGAVSTSALLSALAALFWRMFGDTRIKALEADIKAMKADHEKALFAERHRCDEEIGQLRTQIVQLQTILIANGTPNIRQAIQAAVSEVRVTADHELRHD